MKILSALILFSLFYSCVDNNGREIEIKEFQNKLLAEKFTKHVDEKNYFEIMYPANWIADSLDSFEFPDAIFEAHFMDSTTNYYKLITFVAEDKLGDTCIFNTQAGVGDSTLFFSYDGFMNDNVKEIINLHKRDLSNIISSKKDNINTISGVQFSLLEITHMNDGKRVYRMIGGGHSIKNSMERMIIIITYCNSRNAESDTLYKKTFSKIIRSFNLLN